MAKEDPQPPAGGSPPEQLHAAGEAVKPIVTAEKPPPPPSKSKSEVTPKGILKLSDKLILHNPEAQKIYDVILMQYPEVGDANAATVVREMCERAIRCGKVTGEDAIIFEEIGNRCDDVVAKSYENGKGERFSSIYLTEQEIHEIIQNPALWFEKKLRELELNADDPESILFSSSKRRLELAAEFFGSESFDKSRVLLDPRMSDQSIEQLKKSVDGYARDPSKSRLAGYISARIDGVYLQARLSRATMGDLPDVVKAIRSMGDKGLYTLESYDAGLVGEWRGRYDRIISDLAKNHRLTPADFDRAGEIALQQLMAEKDLVQGRLQNFYQRWQAPGGEPTKFELTDDYAKGIIARARISWRIRMRQAVVMTYGMDPLFGDKAEGVPSYATMNLEEGMLAVSRIRDWFIRKWGKKVVLPVWNMAAKFTARLSPELAGTEVDLPGKRVALHKGIISEKTERLWHDAHQTTDRAKQISAMREIKALLDNNTVDGSGIDAVDDDALIKAMNKKFGLKLTGSFQMKELRELVEIEEGGERLQYMLRPYFYLDSDWRRKLVQIYVNAAYKHAGDYCLGSELKGAGNAYFFDPSKREGQEHAHAGKKFLEVLEHVVRYRPQALAEMLSDGKSESFALWFENHRGDLGYQDANTMFSDLNRRFIMINNDLMMNNLPPIDYQNSELYRQLMLLNKEERLAFATKNIDAFTVPKKKPDRQVTPQEIVDQCEHMEHIFGILGNTTDQSPSNNPDQYFKTMNALHGRLTEEKKSQLFELTSMKYDRFFLSLAWEDDIPTQYLEDPTQFAQHLNTQYLVEIGVLKPGEEPPKDFSLFDPSKNTPEQNAFVQRLLRAAGISEQFTQLGVGPGSPLARAWGDYALAGDAFNAILENNFGPDEKEFFKMIKTVWTKVEMYQGAPIATDAAIKLGAGWIGAAQVKKTYGDFFTGAVDSSVLKEVWGNNAPSLSLDNVMEMRENLERIIPMMERMSPSTAHALSKFLRLSNIHLFGMIDTHIAWDTIFNPFGIASKLGIKPEKLIRKLERIAPMGLTDYKLRMALTLVLVMMALASLNEAKKGGKEGVSSGGGH